MDSVTERSKALKKMPLLASLTPAELDAMATRLQVESYERGVEIIRQGSKGSSAYFVLSGKCEVRRGPLKGARRLCFLEPGDFFGELAVIHPAPRTATVLAHEQTIVMVLTPNEFNTALANNPSMALHLVKVLAKRLQLKEDEFA